MERLVDKYKEEDARALKRLAVYFLGGKINYLSIYLVRLPSFELNFEYLNIQLLPVTCQRLFHKISHHSIVYRNKKMITKRQYVSI